MSIYVSLYPQYRTNKIQYLFMYKISLNIKITFNCASVHILESIVPCLIVL